MAVGHGDLAEETAQNVETRSQMVLLYRAELPQNGSPLIKRLMLWV